MQRDKLFSDVKENHVFPVAFTSLFFVSIFHTFFIMGRKGKEHLQVPRHAGSDCPKPCSSASTCLAADPMSGVPVPQGWWPTMAWAPPLQPLHTGLFALSKKSPPQWGHPLQPFTLLCFPFFGTFGQHRSWALPAVPIWEQPAAFISHHLGSWQPCQVSHTSCGTWACL